MAALSLSSLSLFASLLTWFGYPTGSGDWQHSRLATALTGASAPLLALILAAFSTVTRRPANRLLKRLILLHLGLCIVALLISPLYDPVWAFLAVLAAFPDLLLLFVPGRKMVPKTAAIMHAAIFMVLALPVVVLLLWSPLNIKIIAWRALQLAGQDPYCLESDRPVTRWSQLGVFELGLVLPFIPRDPGPYYAVLVVKHGGADRKFYNWSYRAQNFVPVSNYEAEALSSGACAPVLGFLDKLN